MAAAALLVLAWQLPGCSAGRPLHVGTVDSAAIIHSDPRYQELAQQYLHEQWKFDDKVRAALGDDPSKVDPAQVNRFRQEAQALNEKWVQITDRFLEERRAAMAAAAERVCKEKNIQFVLIDTPDYPTVEYGAVDITPDVVSALRAQAAPPTQEAGR
jgi:hypothetical protein